MEFIVVLFLGIAVDKEQEVFDYLLHKILVAFGLPETVASQIVAAVKVTPSLIAKLNSALSTLKSYIKSFYSMPILCENSGDPENNSAVNTVSIGFAMLLSMFSIFVAFMGGNLSMYLLVKYKKIVIAPAVSQPPPSADTRSRLASIARPIGGSKPVTGSPARNSGLAATMRNETV